MSVLIKDMKMPSCCGECFACESYSVGCKLLLALLDREDYMHERHKDCPLVEIKEPHGRLIDADRATAENIKRTGKRLLAIDTAPTIIGRE